MTAILSYVFYFVASTTSSLQRRGLIKNKQFTSRQQITFTFHCMLFLFAGSLFFPFFSDFYLTGNYAHLIFLAVTCSIFGATANILSYIGQKHLDAGTMSIVWNIYTPVTIVLSSILVHEGLIPLQIVGTLLLLIAIIIISKKHHLGRLRFNRSFVFVLLGGVLIGVLLVAERALQKTTGFSAGTMISWGSQVLGLGIATLLAGSKHTYTKKEVVTTGTLQFLGALSYVMLVWIVGNLSVVTSVTTFKVVLVVIAAGIFLGEKEDLRRKIFGSIVAVIGLLLM
jgi:drug/metabolite transporter (DMT)-like permease